MADQSLRRAREAAAQPPAGAHMTRATVKTWDATNGYVISLNGGDVTAFTILASAGSPSPGDVVAVLRQQTSILVLGAIVNPS
jgi:hypothetical protein